MPPEHDSSHRPLVKPSIVAVCVALYALGCWVQRCGGEQATEPDRTDEAPPESWATDGDSDGGVLRPLPRKPFDGQKHPPCDLRRETELVGACWLPLEGKPGEDLCGIYFHYNGKCYAPVKTAQKVPTSLEP